MPYHTLGSLRSCTFNSVLSSTNSRIWRILWIACRSSVHPRVRKHLWPL